MQVVMCCTTEKGRRFRNKSCCWGSILAVFLGTLISVRAADFYVAPSGSPGGNGSIGNPWDLQTALNHPAAVQPGDTIWLRGGIYTPLVPDCDACFDNRLNGTALAPIMVRQYPGERATLQEPPNLSCSSTVPAILRIYSGSYTWFWGFEIRSTNTTHSTSVSGSGPSWSSLPLPGSVEAARPGIRLINLVVHDTRGGFGLWAAGSDNEAYGCILYNNGWAAPDRGHGHAMYCQNQNGVKHLSDNILFNHFGLGIHAYASGNPGTYLKHFLVERNIIFNNGRIANVAGYAGQQMLFGFEGGTTPLEDVKILDNYVYLPLDQNATLIRPDYHANGNTDIAIANNYFAGGCGGSYLVTSWGYNSLLFTNNFLYSANGSLLTLKSQAGYNVDRNTYYATSSQPFNNNGTQYSFAGWQAATGFDTHSTFQQSVVPPNKVVVKPNAYEPKRANIVVYNWGNSNNVSVDVSSVLSVGDAYEVRNAQDYFAAPVLSGTYTGSPLSLPMTNLTVAIPPGWTNTNAVPTTGKQFNVFVLLGTGATTTTPPQITQPPANQAVLPGQSATFTVSATGTPSLSYQWQRNNSNISGATSTSYTLSNPTSADDGATFRCVVSNAYGTATSAAATLTIMDVTDAPVITAGPVVTNALLQVGNLAVVDSSVPVWLRVDAASAGTLSYQWTFGDGTGSASLPANITSHTYSAPTDCGAYNASVTVSDGTDSTSGNLTVAIAYQLNVTKQQAKLNFAKPDSDSCSLTATFATCPGFDAANKAAVVDIGGAQVSFALDDNGRGRTGPHSCRVTYNKSTGLWTFTAKLKNGAWQTSWDSHGLHNTTIPKPGVAVTMPVILVVGDEAFIAEPQLIYTAKAGKSGSAR